MASTINDINNIINSIDINFPVSGQDNSSQGFRDNFSKIQQSLLATEGQISAILGSSGSGSIIASENINAQTSLLIGSTDPSSLSLDGSENLVITSAGSIILEPNTGVPIIALGAYGLTDSVTNISTGTIALNSVANIMIGSTVTFPNISGVYTVASIDNKNNQITVTPPIPDYPAPFSVGQLLTFNLPFTAYPPPNVEVQGDLIVSTNLTVSGSITAENLTASGSVTATNLTVSGSITTANLTASNSITTANLTASGSITTANLTASGSITSTAMSVTESANANNYSYYRLTRTGQINAGFGISGTNGALGLGANAFWFGTSTSTMSSAWIAFNGSNLVATGDIAAFYSDRRLKTNVNPIKNAVDKVTKLNGITYNPNDLAATFGYNKELKFVGLFADDVESVLPEAVKLAPFDNDNGTSKSGENYKTVQYEKIVPLLVEAIKEQQQQIAQLKAIVDSYTTSNRVS
jgi:Chaperone of endosialidase/Mucin-like